MPEHRGNLFHISPRTLFIYLFYSLSGSGRPLIKKKKKSFKSIKYARGDGFWAGLLGNFLHSSLGEHTDRPILRALAHINPWGAASQPHRTQESPVPTRALLWSPPRAISSFSHWRLLRHPCCFSPLHQPLPSCLYSLRKPPPPRSPP